MLFLTVEHACTSCSIVTQHSRMECLLYLCAYVPPLIVLLFLYVRCKHVSDISVRETQMLRENWMPAVLDLASAGK